MRKFHPAFVAGAVVVGLGAIVGLAAFAPSLIAKTSATHELTLKLPGGGTETIAYVGKVAPKVTFKTQEVATTGPAFVAYDWAVPSVMTFDPVFADVDRAMDALAAMPLLIAPEQPLSAATLNSLPAGSSYSVVSQTIGNGVCTHTTQITKAAGDAKPQIVSQSSGNCGSGADKAVTAQPTPTAKAINLRTSTGHTTTQSL